MDCEIQDNVDIKKQLFKKWSENVLSPHKLRKVRKRRASRTHGYGRVGQHRGGGKRGGHGKAGFHKHGWTYVVKYEPDYYGKRGFTSPRTIGKKVNVINVGQLEELVYRLAVKEQLKKKGEKVLLDLKELGYDKLLGMGNITKPLLVRVAFHSESAAKKVQEAGGQILEETEPVVGTKN
jgi:large subunit ribosomal protein L15